MAGFDSLFLFIRGIDSIKVNTGLAVLCSDGQYAVFHHIIFLYGRRHIVQGLNGVGQSGRHSVPSLHIYLQGSVAGQGGSVDSLFLFHFKGLGFHGDAGFAYGEKGTYADGYIHAAVIPGVRYIILYLGFGCGHNEYDQID